MAAVAYMGWLGGKNKADHRAQQKLIDETMRRLPSEIVKESAPWHSCAPGQMCRKCREYWVFCAVLNIKRTMGCRL